MTRTADLPPIRSPRHVAWACVFAAWGILLGVLLVSGGLDRYLAPRNRPFALIASLVMLGLAGAEWRRAPMPHRGDPDDEAHLVDCTCRWQEAPKRTDLVSGAMFLLPLVVLSIVPAGTLGASAARNRGLSASLPGRRAPVTVAAAAKGPGEVTVLDIAYAVGSPEYADQIGIHPGSRVKLTGVVVKGDTGFVLTRFLITCCVADAVPIGVRVTGQAAAAAKDNAWVTAEGVISWTARTGTGPIDSIAADLSVDRLDPVPAPKDPYLY